MENSLSSTSKLVNVTRTNDALTANMAVTHSTSLSAVVDMFFLAGASRTMPERSIRELFARAFAENPEMALKCLFWARDVRGGAGERRFFRICWEYIRSSSMSISHPDTLAALDILIPEFGRWDDVWAGLETLDDDMADWISRRLIEAQDGLCAKWLPRKGKIFNSLRRFMKLTPKELRKIIVSLSNTVEQRMCAKEWIEIEYAKIPSVAMHKYRKAYLRNDPDRFNMFLTNVENGTEKIHAGTIFPHTLVKKIIEGEDAERTTEAQWKALPDFMEGSTERLIPVCDVSGSMHSPDYLPISVSVALGLYISERNKSIFKDAFITFSGQPTMQYIKPGTLHSRVHQLSTADWGMNTDLQAVFSLILRKAVENGLSEDDMPTKVIIISDMEFDQARGYHNDNNFRAIEQRYAQAGFKRPQIIFWNVNGRIGNCPVQIGTEGTALVSGFSPAILKDILKGDVGSPETFVYKVLMSDRYKEVTL
jgi:hypothetical protein